MIRAIHFRRFVIAFSTASLLTMQTTALAQAHDQGLAAGQAANAATRPYIDEAAAASVVPGYTRNPSQAALYGDPNLNEAGSQHLNACSSSDDPLCQGVSNAWASAQTPRDAISATDPAVSTAQAVSSNPAATLGDLSAYYSGCDASGNCSSQSFCFAGNCFDTQYADDTDFAQTMSFMEAAREAGVYMDPDTLEIFKGEGNSCRNRLFKNCCSSDSAGRGMTNQSIFGTGSRLVYDVLMNSSNRQFLYHGMQALLLNGGFSGTFTSYGVTVAVNGAALPAGSSVLYAADGLVIAFDPWTLAIAVVIYVVMSMMSCNENEGKLSMQEGASLCHTIGTYCSSCIRVLGKCVSCIERTTGKCCFNSVLARIINQQARVQFGKGWGSARTPDCSGFTVAQLQAMDFAAMDLTEFYSSIVPALPDVSALQDANRGTAAQCYYGEGNCQ